MRAMRKATLFAEYKKQQVEIQELKEEIRRIREAKIQDEEEEAEE
jgi:hypothetical protein